jgi:hypothetical protein
MENKSFIIAMAVAFLIVGIISGVAQGMYQTFF